jgi:serine/threonine-protein kinase RsbW
MSASDLTFTLRNQRSEIERMFSLLEEFCRSNRLSEDDMYNVRLVLDEAVINIITHGYDDADEHAIEVDLALDGHLLVIHVADDGVAYNPLDAPNPRFDLPFEQRRIGGLGVHLLKSLARDVQYRREDGRNHLRVEMLVGQEQ